MTGLGPQLFSTNLNNIDPTCKPMYEPALDALWSHLDGFVRLVATYAQTDAWERLHRRFIVEL
ncbi:hypothetical protein HYDPIDRAFT_117592 [Hydnomerulius pinastri MD-312]|uniref:Uncharacterized protein n=1 Tax=Hydnomerulius pinastri MD-312 TaxID=994086 RepID=A0A0C9WAG8_9AGAM|nr:hypothetical protein HYDPIDRAFT_117592 [Hydnomerulius pinastri MD-312]